MILSLYSKKKNILKIFENSDIFNFSNISNVELYIKN